MMPLGEPARRVVIRAGLGLFLRRTAEELGITIAEARDITQSVLAEERWTILTAKMTARRWCYERAAPNRLSPYCGRRVRVAPMRLYGGGCRWPPRRRRMGFQEPDARRSQARIVQGEPWHRQVGDFATGDRGGDLVSLAAYLFKFSQADAALKVADMIGVEPYEQA